MSIVVFDPDASTMSISATACAIRMTAMPSNGMWLSDTEPSVVDADELRDGRLAQAARLDGARPAMARVVLFDPVQPALRHRLAQHVRLFPAQLDALFLHSGRRADRPVRISAELSCLAWCSTRSTRRGRRKLVWSSVSGRDDETAGPFADEIADLLQDAWRRLEEDRPRPLQPSPGAGAGEARAARCSDCQGEILAVRAVKTPEEVKCLQVIDGRRRSRGRRGARGDQARASRENELFAIMYHEVIRQGGEFIETRLLTSGQRTNPWFNEASGRKIRPGELVALDTDTIGCYGYYSDFSRTFRCGPGKPTAYQKIALPHVARPGAAQYRHHQAGHGLPRDRREGLEDPANASSTSAIRRSCMASACMARRRSSPMPWTSRPMAAKASSCPAWW